MTLILDLPGNLEAELTAAASRRGLSLPEYALRVLAEAKKEESAPWTGAELVEYWRREGLIGTRPDIADSAAYAREIRAQAEKRSRD